jgi:8-oxo-dGTP pyrophosphatase MutT (NUDIX family)
MNYDSFLTSLKSALQQTLPAEKAHELLSPPARKKLVDINLEELKPRLSAVMILIFNENNSSKIVVIKRPQYEGVHSGQIALPGGKFETSDQTLENTALRETEEEIGIASHQINVIGKLSDIYIPPSNFIVSPYVGYIPQKPFFTANQREVEAVHTFEIELLNQNNIINKTILHSNGNRFNTPSYQINDLSIWGATAMILSEFAMLLANKN